MLIKLVSQACIIYVVVKKTTLLISCIISSFSLICYSSHIILAKLLAKKEALFLVFSFSECFQVLDDFLVILSKSLCIQNNLVKSNNGNYYY